MLARLDHTGELVAQAGGIRPQGRMAVQDALDVGVAGRRRSDGEHDLARAGDGLGDVLDAEVTGAMDQRGPHGAVTMTLMPSRLRAAASAAPVWSSGKRWVIMRSVAIAPPAISASAARVSAGPAE